MPNGSSPHDAVFRRVLGQSVNAASQLAATLPKTLVDRLDLGQLTLVQASFVDAALQWRHSDLLFTAPLAGRQAFIYLLIEHQSREDKLMPFRMLHYLVRIWDRYLTEHPRATSLPAIIPLVVHHNRRAWQGSTPAAGPARPRPGHRRGGFVVPALVPVPARRPGRGG